MSELIEFLSHGYWADVETLLIEEHELTKNKARDAIADFRRRLAAHEVGDIVYHEDSSRIAKTIANAAKAGGFVEPGEMAMKNGKSPAKRHKRSK